MYFLAPICRVCIKNDSILINIYNLDNDKISYYHKLKLCYPEIVFENINMHTYICQNCCSNLKRVHEFQVLCSNSGSVLKRYVSQLENTNSLKDNTQNKLNELIDKNYKELNSIIKIVPKVEMHNSEIEINIIRTENLNFKYVDNKWLEPTCLVNIKNEEIKLNDNDCENQDHIKEDQNNQIINKNNNADANIPLSNLGTSQLKRRIGPKRIDNSEKRFKCDVCFKSFNHSGKLQRHKRIHTGEKPYVCQTCSKSFTRLDNLHSHARIHTGEKPYVCDICNKCFNQSSDVLRHKRVHTGEKPYVCDTCSKCFSQSSDLQKHIRIHTGEKPYVCNICSKSFNQTYDLQKHNRIHTGEKPYECDICSKSFNRLDNLHLHKRIHTGEKPYDCDVCDKSFNQLSNLRTHKLIHITDK